MHQQDLALALPSLNAYTGMSLNDRSMKPSLNTVLHDALKLIQQTFFDWIILKPIFILKNPYTWKL